MLTSLFGDLGPAIGLRRPSGKTSDADFAATAIMESVATQLNARGQMVDRHSQDLVVSGSPAQAIRGHFADTRADLDTAASLITLLDPAGVWASAVIKALSDAGGQPIERLHLRERSTLRTLATIERTSLARRHEDTLRIYHADVRAPGSENAQIPIALMERSQMTTVIIGPLQPHAIDTLLGTLHTAVMLPTWRCPNLLFMLPPNAVWIADKINAMAWPGRLHVHVLRESMSGASSVWNAMLGMWNQVKSQPGWEPLGGASAGMAAELPRIVPGMPMFREPEPALAPSHALMPANPQPALAGLAGLPGMIGCALVDAASGQVLALQAAADGPACDLNRMAAASALVLQAHRQAARSMGLADEVDEVISSAGQRQQIMRALVRQPELFLFALLEKHRTSMATVRFQLIEAERALAWN